MQVERAPRAKAQITFPAQPKPSGCGGGAGLRIDGRGCALSRARLQRMKIIRDKGGNFRRGTRSPEPRRLDLVSAAIDAISRPGRACGPPRPAPRIIPRRAGYRRGFPPARDVSSAAASASAAKAATRLPRAQCGDSGFALAGGERAEALRRPTPGRRWNLIQFSSAPARRIDCRSRGAPTRTGFKLVCTRRFPRVYLRAVLSCSLEWGKLVDAQKYRLGFERGRSEIVSPLQVRSII